MSNTNSQIISFLRFPLTFLVVAIHSRGEIGQVPDLMHITARNLYDMVKVLGSDVIAQVAVPSFFFISGYLFFANVETWNSPAYRAKMLRRLKTLLLPYLIWNLLMAIKLRTFSWSIFWVFWCPAGILTDWL